jgi:hypothetical protein
MMKEKKWEQKSFETEVNDYGKEKKQPNYFPSKHYNKHN